MFSETFEYYMKTTSYKLHAFETLYRIYLHLEWSKPNIYYIFFILGTEIPCPLGETSDNNFTPGCECK